VTSRPHNIPTVAASVPSVFKLRRQRISSHQRQYVGLRFSSGCVDHRSSLPTRPLALPLTRRCVVPLEETAADDPMVRPARARRCRVVGLLGGLRCTDTAARVLRCEGS
jgi:hypothetical protein